MKKAKLHITSLFFIFLFASCTTAKVQYNELKTNTQKKQIKKLLFVGHGTTASRIFLDNLMEQLKDELQRKNVETDYVFVPLNKNLTDPEFQAITNKNFDGIIHFTPLYNTSMKETLLSSTSINNRSVTVVGGGTSSTYSGQSISTSTRTQYIESYEILLSEKTNLLWLAHLNINFDLKKNAIYKDITDRIVNRMEANLLFD